MEYTEEKYAMLHQIPSPAFFVRDGIITEANVAALQRQIPVDSPIADLLHTGQEEYPQFSDGCLYLTLQVCGSACSASVKRIGGHDLFVLEQDADQAELQSMALAAQALRTPLSNVMTVADQFFPLDCFDGSDQAQLQIARINRGLYQMLRIICNMSDAYRYGCETALRGEIRDIAALIREHFDLTADLMEHTGITLRYTGPNETIFSLVDTEKLERAISNILSNAMKFTPKGGCIEACLTRKEKTLYLTVQDSGSGVPEEITGTVYHRYLRQPGIEDGRFGIGLGMVLIRNAATAHGGTVLTQQTPNGGLRLTMTIPIRQSADPMVRSPIVSADYAGERDHRLLEFSDCLPAELYRPDNIN